MNRNLNRLKTYRLLAVEGEIGRVGDFYFDDRTGKIRYLVARTDGWLAGRKVLVSPVALGRPDAESGVLPVGLSKQQIENSPPWNTDKPISRQYETELAAYYHWPTLWGPALPPLPLDGDKGFAEDPHLRSIVEILGYGVESLDGNTGHIEDALIDDASWAISNIIVDTRNWLPGGRKIVLTWPRITSFDAIARNVSVDRTTAEIEQLPEILPDSDTGGDRGSNPVAGARAAAANASRHREELKSIPGIGARKAERLFDALAIVSIPELLRAARAGRIREIEGFGKKTERHVLDWLEKSKS